MLFSKPLYCQGTTTVGLGPRPPSTLTVQQSHGLFYNLRRIAHLIAASYRFVGASVRAGIHYATSTLRFVFTPLNLSQVRRRLQMYKTPVRYLETFLRIPYVGYRIGITTLIGMVPIVGSVVTVTMAMYPLILAAQTPNLPSDVLPKMMFNALLGGALGLIPLVGGLCANIYRPTWRNLRMLDKWLLKLETAVPLAPLR
ncbi:hypothetical protein DFJ77DRAFT_550696 [Powellomyces hirtus]|nr:hypothetical protein DFJ77DRAFT_550696 [Powellomyces hirtus]